ncbi:LPXTG cell wall anchor domain-containing protein [Listeria grandensis]|uniref:LPXTG cell wall anchor domain-containing protein n=1 Tax=Listeria grandensis TaxID=1494963 RepID=A0A7X0Y4T1_9LIST|nr:SpaA isopeptide-forming pilin-related protein [Listeria grandensis]MBC1936966.1 LPXTG cell wall anchor domain-containing protein [Listeria grandensis]
MKNKRKYLITLICFVLFLQSFSLIAAATQAKAATNSIKTAITVPSGSITNREEVTLKVDLSGSAGSFTPANGDLTVTVPKDIVYSVTDFTSKLNLPVPFKLKSVTSDGANYKILISIDTTLIASNEAFHGIFQIQFGAPILTIGDTHNDTQTFSVDYATTHDDITVDVSKKNPIVPVIFDKWYKGDLDENNVAVLNTTTPANNKFQLVVNYKQVDLNDVIITDTLPVGTSLVATDKNSNIAGDSMTVENIRILKATTFDAQGLAVGFKYATAEFQNKISYDTTTRTFKVDLGDVAAEDTYFIEYALKVDDPDLGAQVNTANFTASNTSAIHRAFPVKVIQHFGTSYVLSKSVDKQVLNYDENTLTYTLKLMSLDGASIPAGTVITDPLDSRIHITSILDYDKSKFDIQYDADSVTITTLVDTPKNGSNSWAFEANVSTLKVGESLLNSAYMNVSNNIIQSNTVATKKYDGRIQIMKTDNFNQPVAGAEYTIADTNGTVVFQGETDKAGILLSAALQTGTYTIVETAAPTGYVLDNTPQTVTITEQDTNPIILQTKNVVKTGSVELTKVDSDDHSVTLAGATFDLLDEQGTILKTGLTTAANGVLKIASLNPGKYSLVETSAPTGYTLDSTPIAFEIAFGANLTPVTLVKENTMKNGSVELTKVDSDNHAVTLAGATFNLLDEQGALLKQKLTTDSHGVLKVSDLKPGKYSFVETSAPSGYTLDKTPIAFEILFGDNQTPVTVVKENTMKNGSAELTKVDSANKQTLLPGAVFNLLDEQGTVLRQNLTTDINGYLKVANLKPGKYSLVETAAPSGYTLDSTPVAFEIAFGDDQTPVTVSKENTMKNGSVELTKVDSDDHAVTLAGATFDLLDEQGTILKTGLTTDGNGFLEVSDLKPGKYSFVETAAPFGYTLDSTPITFEITFGDDQTPITLVKENTVKHGSVELTKVDSDDHAVTLAGATFDLLDEQGAILQTGLTTDDGGSLKVSDLKPGKYSFVETAAPIGYTLDSTPIAFEIVFGDDQTPVTVVKENTIKNGSVELTKVSASNHSILLAGAVFDLLDAQGAVLQEGLTTDENGLLAVDGLKPGKYSFVETAAPAGYTLDSTPLLFEIPFGDDQTPVKVVMENAITFQPAPPSMDDPTSPGTTPGSPDTEKPGTKEKTTIKDPAEKAPALEETSTPTKMTYSKIPKTGDSSERNLILIGLVLCLLASMLFIAQARTRKN